MDKYNITGMSCAACSARVEKAVKNLDGVSECSVNLLTNSMTVEGTALPQSVISAVQKAGYGAALSGNNKQSSAQKEQKSETKPLVIRLVVSLAFLLVLMYVSMGHAMLSLPLPSFFERGATARALLQLILSAIILLINNKFFVSGVKAALHGSPNMDSLVALGSGASFIYSTVMTFVISEAERIGDLSALSGLSHNLYFESAAMIVTLITLGKILESYSKGKTTSAIKQLMSLAPETVTVIRNGKEQTLSVSEVVIGDTFIVRPGERIAVDGVIEKGDTTVDQASLTGESMPVDKKEGDTVLSSTINLSGFITCRATKVGENTTLAQIIKMVTDAAATKAPISKIADKVSAIFVPIVLVISLITLIVWLFFDKTIGFALSRAISVLVISCPCSLGLATPVAIMVASGVGAKNGVLFKTAAAIENTGKIKTIVFDKTGTVTNGKPVITDIVCAGDELLPFAYCLEKQSEHPLAKAVVNYCEQNGIPLSPCNNFKTTAGGGVEGFIKNQKVFGGSFRFVSQFIKIDEEYIQKATELSNEGKTLLYFATETMFLGILAVADTVKPDSAFAISGLKLMGIHTVMLTGDNKPTAQKIASSVGIEKVISNVLPSDKANEIQNLKKHNITAMVGDGINDATALTVADVGIAIGAGTDIAIDSAEVVLVNSNLTDALNAIKLGRVTLKNIYQNLFWAFFYNALGIPIAAGVLIAPFGIELSPMFAAFAMSLSSFCVVLNALRLNLIKFNKKEDKKMEITLKIEGMMCPHCENHVKTALEKIAGVEKAEPNHKTGTAKIITNGSVSITALETAVTDCGYTIIK